MKAVRKIITIFFILLVLSLAKGNGNNVKLPAAYQHADKNLNELGDDNYNYGCGFHIVFNSTLY